MFSLVKNLKDGEYLVDETTALKLEPSLIAQFDEDSDAVKAKELHRAIENNNIKAAAYSIKGKSATPLYRTVDLGIDGEKLQ